MNLKIHPDALVLNQARQAGKTPEECRILKAKDYKLPILTRYREGAYKKEFYFVQIGGPLFGQAAFPEDDVQAERSKMERVAEAVNKMKPKPRFLAICGNFTLSAPGEKGHFPQIEAFKSSLRALDSDVAVICVCGSHDVGETPSEESVEAYRENFGEERFSFWVEGVHCLVLNSMYFRKVTDLTEFRKEQFDWLESNVLEAQVNPPVKMLIFQGSSCLSDKNGDLNGDCETEQQVISKLKEADVSAIFCGNSNKSMKEGNIGVYSCSSLGICDNDAKPGLRVVRISRGEICQQFFTLDESPEELDSLF